MSQDKKTLSYLYENEFFAGFSICNLCKLNYTIFLYKKIFSLVFIKL